MLIPDQHQDVFLSHHLEDKHIIFHIADPALVPGRSEEYLFQKDQVERVLIECETAILFLP